MANTNLAIWYNSKTRKKIALLEIERYKQYLDKVIGEAEKLKPLVEQRVDDDPAMRPTIETVCEMIQVCKNAFMKEFPQECITLYKKVEQLTVKNKQQEIEIKQH